MTSSRLSAPVPSQSQFAAETGANSSSRCRSQLADRERRHGGRKQHVDQWAPKLADADLDDARRGFNGQPIGSVAGESGCSGRGREATRSRDVEPVEHDLRRHRLPVAIDPVASFDSTDVVRLHRRRPRYVAGSSHTTGSGDVT